MGKSKPNRNNKQVRDNPTGIVSKRVDSEEVVVELGATSPYRETALSSDTLKSLSLQLQSSLVEERDSVSYLLDFVVMFQVCRIFLMSHLTGMSCSSWIDSK